MKQAGLVMVAILAWNALATDQTRQREEEEIREAVFRWQFAHNASAQRKNARAYYLAVGDKRDDPSHAFVARFAGQKPPVRKRSECVVDKGRGVVDKKTGEWGILFRVAGIVWRSEAEVEVKGGYFEGNLSAAGHTYFLRKQGDRWEVVSDRMDWIS